MPESGYPGKRFEKKRVAQQVLIVTFSYSWGTARPA
jgi:hypothetical protein